MLITKNGAFFYIERGNCSWIDGVLIVFDSIVTRHYISCESFVKLDDVLWREMDDIYYA